MQVSAGKCCLLDSCPALACHACPGQLRFVSLRCWEGGHCPVVPAILHTTAAREATEGGSWDHPLPSVSPFVIPVHSSSLLRPLAPSLLGPGGRPWAAILPITVDLAVWLNRLAGPLHITSKSIGCRPPDSHPPHRDLHHQATLWLDLGWRLLTSSNAPSVTRCLTRGVELPLCHLTRAVHGSQP